MAGLFEAHDKERFEITAISFGPDDNGDMRKRLQRSFDRFVDVRDKSDHEISILLQQGEIDIAVNLGGFTAGSRTGVLANRAAPVQVSYLGYPGTMGAEYVDYILADPHVIPPEHRASYAEKVVYLPDSYMVNDSRRAIADHTLSRAETGLPENGFVFCCFNNNFKITPDIFDIWMRLLHKVKGSVLWLSENSTVASNNLRKEAWRRGIPAERLIFAPRMKLVEEHLARHTLADLFLDTLPYNAHTTASDALWAGLPVLSCTGNAFAGRVAASLLHAIGLPELVTATLAEYEALALKLATMPDMLAGIRAKLARNRTTHPLFDTDRFRRHMEAAYITMWERYQHGESPASFAVQPIS
jgi:predicted O-linked N-acetylglucosamine transferase (SPINDLY family)